MTKMFLTILMVSLLLTIGCQTSTGVKKDDHAGHSNTNPVAKETGDFSLEFTPLPAQIKAGEQTDLVFTVKNAKGETIKDLQIVHEKPIHLLIVSEDLAEFYHEHPEPQPNGTFKVPFTFKNGGKFKIYADFTPPGGKQTVKSLTTEVTGQTRPREELKTDEKFEKTVDELLVMTRGEGLSSGKSLMLDFQVFDAKTKKPVTDLQNYLGEKAHFVVISQDLKEFVHAHPMSAEKAKTDQHQHADHAKHGEKPAGTEAASIVSAHLTFPTPGRYKIFAQFQRNNKVTTVPFVVEVKAGADSAGQLKTAEIPKEAYKITVSKEGFVPGEISIKKGSFTKLALVRVDEENCADEVIFKSLNLRQKLPVGEVVMVDLPPDFSGELSFTCGMNMYQGKVIVE